MAREKGLTFFIPALICFAFIGMMFFTRWEASAQPRFADRPVSTVEETSPVGYWQSVDYVEKVEDFVAGQKKFSGDPYPYLKELSVFPGGTTTIGWTWADGNISGIFKGVSYVTPYFVQASPDSTYLFLPW
ncbi:MAG: hypothetical protein ACYC9O_18850, partial [Candidatus Latescibacterota bacterium]